MRIIENKARRKTMKKAISIMLSAVIVMGILFTTMKAQAASAPVSAGIVSVSGGTLNVRSGSSTGSSVVASLTKGAYVTLVQKTGSWWRVEYGDNKFGYCCAEYITSVSGTVSTVSTRSNSLNVRSGPGTSYSVKGSLSKGETVIVLSASGGWSHVLYDGTKTGYASAVYLSPASDSRYPAVYLSVPSYKQTDSRWAAATLGSSGRSIASIGCATTALAMTESYRTGAAIYPNVMAKKLNYTSSGSVYWPDNYVSDANGSGYLSRIYELLKQGKPVLIGAKTYSGNQHWVVVTGYKGGSALSASGFAINDPGSNSRTNLQQFFNSYPVFYKYLYYR